jgi:hydroxymethylbilane synthase
MKLRIATRRSDLALVQARRVAGAIRQALGVEVDLVPLQTTGDRLKEARLADVGGKGLFVKEIEEALLDGRADVAVHSAKDLPAELAPGLRLAAFPERADPRDALVAAAPGGRLLDLPRGARVGTGSVRRTAQLLAARPDLEIVPLRGNVLTRLRKLDENDLHAIVLACAGLDRLGLADRIAERIAPELLLPAPTQGILAVETREEGSLADDLRVLDAAAARVAAEAERSFLAVVEGDCKVPVAALAEVDPGEGVRIRGLVAALDGSVLARGAARGADAAAAGVAAARQALAAGGEEILRRLREVSR